jgi:hypothetical protein
MHLWEPHSPPQTRTRFAAYPPCTGTIYQNHIRIAEPLASITARNGNKHK